MFGENEGVILKEETVLEKFEGNKLLERITIVDGEIVNHEVFEPEEKEVE